MDGQESSCAVGVAQAREESAVNEDKRLSGRRETERRMADMLQGVLDEQERQLLDAMLSRQFLAKDRRVNTRRSGKDRRDKRTE